MHDSQSTIANTPGSFNDPGEKTLIVACEFTGRKYRQRLTASAQLAKDAMLVTQDATRDQSSSEDETSEPIESLSTRDAASISTLSAEAAECRELAESAGANVLDVILQRRDHPDPATLVGKGKLEQIGAAASARRADLIIFEQDLSPSQLRELERALPCRVIDRTQLILDIFASHARTREGQLQVELAQLEYMLPRLAGRGRSMSQLGGGIGTRGPGETQLETDRRKIGRKIQIVRSRLEAVRGIRRQQRQRRSSVPVPTVALVGYTNAGKSTLFNALTQAGVLESSRMFATLDPKLHLVTLPSRRRILLSDTVGFIRALPHTLVNAFRATLEEVQMAEVLVHVMDASSASLDVHREEVEKVLRELEVENKPRVEVMNKIDLLPKEQRISRRQGGAIAISARAKTGLDAVLAAIDAALESDPLEERDLEVPQGEGAVLAALDAGGIVVERTFQDAAVHMRVRGPASLLGRYRKYWRSRSTRRRDYSRQQFHLVGK
ncbi:MAG: GTPase HflX [Acidobacteriaceae bacterium]